MAASTVLNQRQHVGLQTLSALSDITTQFLGPTKTFKIIQDDATSESALVSSCYRVLENLELTGAVSQLVYETVEAHHKIYKTGSGCLLFMAGAWSRAALECLHREIPIAHIISAMSEGMTLCLSTFMQCVIPNKELYTKLKSQPNKSTVKDSANQQLSSNKTQRKLKLSRHFQEPEFENISITPKPKIEKTKISDIGRTLSHGYSEAMDLVVKASQIQYKEDLTFDVDKISICLLPCFAETHNCVLPGCIVPVCPEQAIIARNFKKQDLKVALIDGHLTSTFRHLGYNKAKRLQRVSEYSSSDGHQEEWLECIVRLLLNLEVNVLLISGVADEKLKDHFWKHNILVVEKMRLSVLKTFALSTGAILVSYATQLNSRCIGTGITVNLWKDLSNFANKSNYGTYLNISTIEKSGLVTVVLSSWVQGKLQSEEDAFLACAYRLHWALKDKSLLPGAGVTEMYCISELQKQAQLYASSHKTVPPRTAAGPYTGVVLQLMADGFIDFVTTVMVNTGKYSKVEARTVVVEQLHGLDGSVNSAKMAQMCLKDDEVDSDCNKSAICDNLTVKQEVWRKALDLVFLVLQTDAEVITGLDQKQLEQRDLMIL
ncbi:hypothetical protein NL108_000576 [Boleophthalmus pectinirostris]|uniref:Bardet-Biedl syndrome 12 protein n=1 Tax=Boleophthalmus pectinirostris TaxID=150288 RepID=UPI0024325D04|nr:Bardet-Biedl syndrome 12 protein [Boleophthalmus pectinirostris]KAJ0049726.1 hypothetical protein NL108_000576 [Boleophthalmus pectinirostris]